MNNRNAEEHLFHVVRVKKKNLFQIETFIFPALERKRFWMQRNMED